MPRLSANSHPFDALIERAAAILGDRLASVIGRAQATAAKGGRVASAGRRSAGLTANEKRSRTMSGRKLEMACRVEGCKNRSRGPRWGFMCEQHQKLPKKQQEAAREAWKAKHSA